ncbi:Txe/YoeB family addiction module toxin [Acetobacteraceae bacterium KSS8]|uniref:Putative mRNA interferase YoeB n=1 Tax=Endosaccharibacter trunci TaxID=2812733 RepID=A0ABT1W8L9_9PROT|nr:Txe/YoeB family addiction module toxin [Acetobacteraceae bacterium KSS8]
MKICFTAEGWEDYQFWVENDRDSLARVNALIGNIRRTPFQGLGKPEPLKGDLAGWWSCRITLDHRFVYAVEGGGAERRLIVAACRYHYR